MRSMHIRFLNMCAHAYMYNINPMKLTRFIHLVLRCPLVHYHYKKTYLRVNKLSSKVSWNKAKEVTISVFWPYPFERNHFSKSSFQKTIQMPFEGLKVNVPEGYDTVLGTLYGDYMSFPKVSDRGNWHKFTFDPDHSYKEIQDMQLSKSKG